MADFVPEQPLFTNISSLIEQAKARIVSQENYTATRLYWQIGNMINTLILQEKRTEYGKQIVSPLATQSSWSHFIKILPLKTPEAKLFYAEAAVSRGLSAKGLREQIICNTIGYTAIADPQLTPNIPVLYGVFNILNLSKRRHLSPSRLFFNNRCNLN